MADASADTKKGEPVIANDIIAKALEEVETKGKVQDDKAKALAARQDKQENDIVEQGELLAGLEQDDAAKAAEDKNQSIKIEKQGKKQNKMLNALKELKKLNLLRGISSKEKLKGNIKMIYIIGSIITILLLSSPLLSKLIVGGGLKRRTKRR